MISNNILLTIVNILISLLDVLVVLLPILLSVAFMTIIERKQLAAHQRRVGPNTVGYYGLLQPFSDALKLILKETIVPSQSNKVLFYLSPVSTLIFSLLGWGIIPFGQGLALSDFTLGVLYSLALSSLGGNLLLMFLLCFAIVLIHCLDCLFSTVSSNRLQAR